MERFADRVADATIPVKGITGRVIVTGRGDDQVWPSDRFAHDVADRRAVHGLDTALITSPTAGHHVVLPGEEPVAGGIAMSRSGSAAADAALGERVWTEMTQLLGLR